MAAQLHSAPVPPPATIVQEYWDGSAWEPLEVELDETWALMRQGRMILSAPTAAVAKASLGAVAAPLYWLRVRLVAEAYDATPRLEQVLSNTATAIQATTIASEVLGGSNGMPNQGPVSALHHPGGDARAAVHP